MKGLSVKIWDFLFLGAIFFPYISLVSFGTDIQPQALIFSIVSCGLYFLNSTRMNKRFVYPFVVLFIAFLTLLITQNFLEGFRSFLGYMSLFFIPLATYNFIRKKRDLFVSFLKISTIIYFLVALTQLLYDRFFLSNLLNRMSTTLERGVTSLAPEPTFYAAVVFFLLLIFYSLPIKNKIWYQLLLIFQIVFLSMSSMIILYLSIFLFAWFFFRSNFIVRTVTLGIGFILFTTFKVASFENESGIRVISLLNLLINNPMEVISMDASINDRVSAIYFSFKGFFQAFFLPHGFGNYVTYLQTELTHSVTFWWVSISNRIMSFYGACFFELGFVGTLIPFFINKTIYGAYKKEKVKLYVILVVLNLLLLAAIPLSFTLVGMYIAVLLYKENFNSEKEDYTSN